MFSFLQTPSPLAISQSSPIMLTQQVVRPQPWPLAASQTQPSGAAGTTKHVSIQVEEEEVTIKIVRTTGMGLGISIAGGRGSTPYRGTDEVCALSM